MIKEEFPKSKIYSFIFRFDGRHKLWEVISQVVIFAQYVKLDDIFQARDSVKLYFLLPLDF